MRKEEKTICRYIAFDGREFESESECKAHEECIPECRKQIIMFDNNGMRINSYESDGDSGLERAYFIDIPDGTEKYLISFLCDYYRNCRREYRLVPDCPGKWYCVEEYEYFDEYDYYKTIWCWKNFEQQLEKINTVQNVFLQNMSGIKHIPEVISGDWIYHG